MVTAEAGMTITSAAQAVYIDPTKKLNSNAKEILTVKNWKDTNVTVYPIIQNLNLKVKQLEQEYEKNAADPNYNPAADQKQLKLKKLAE